MELYQDIDEILKLLFVKYSIKSLMQLDILLWKTNIEQRRLPFFGPKIWSKINPSNCNRIPIHNHLVRKRTLN